MRVKLKNLLFILGIFISLSGVSLASNVYTYPPSYLPPYYAVALSYEVIMPALNEVNYIRRLMGLPDVVLSEEYTRRAQHGAVLLDILNTLTHTPSKPTDMNPEFYALAYDATTHSNLATRQQIMGGQTFGAISLIQSIRDYMNDSDAYNISELGHRRWLMNPRMKYTGFGLSTRRGYASMYVIEEFRKGNGKSRILTKKEYDQYLQWMKWPVNYEFVTWPVNMNLHPLMYFDAETAWCVVLNHDVFDKCNINSVNVSLIRLRDGGTWRFSSKQSDGYFRISGGSIAYDECIIFRPMNVGGYGHHETWRVQINGLKRKNSQGMWGITYDVTFTM